LRCSPPFAPSVSRWRAVFLEPEHLEAFRVGIALLLAGLLHPALDEVDTVFVDLRPVGEKSFDLHVDDVTDIDDRVRLAECH